MLLKDDEARGVPIWNMAARAALPMEEPVFMGTALPVLIGLPLMGGPGGERERPVDGGASDLDLPGGLRGAVLGGAVLGGARGPVLGGARGPVFGARGPVLGGAGALRGPVLGAFAGALDEAPPGVGGGERDLGALGGGCDFVALALALAFGGGAPGPLGGGALGGPLGGGAPGPGPAPAPGPGPGPAMSAATLAVSGVSARMLSVRSRSIRSVRAMPWSCICFRRSTRACCFC